MIRFYSVVSAASIGMFAALILLMSAFGSTQPIHPALRGFVEGCEAIPQPCWYGIVPGSSERFEVEQLLAQAGYVQSTSVGTYQPSDAKGCTARLGYDAETTLNLQVIELFNCGFRLGDLMGVLGFPRGITGNRSHVTFEYEHGITVLVNDTFNPQSFVRAIFMLPPCSQLTEQTAWYGFMPMWRYNQLEPDGVTICTG